MSGEPFEGSVLSTNLSVSDFNQVVISCSNYQFERLSLGEVAQCEEFNSSKLLTEKQVGRLVQKYENVIERTICEQLRKKRIEKYAMHGLNLGVVSYGKYKPTFREAGVFENAHFRKPKGSKIKGYLAEDRSFDKLGEAKKYAKDRFMITGKGTHIYKRYVDSYGRTVDKMRIGAIVGEKIGEMKSMPKNPPKAHIVKPIYLYLVTGCLCDAEYEWI